MKTPTILIIMDGFGLRGSDMGNAVHAAKTPVLDKLFAENPCSRLSASGLDVGLPAGQMGNSEVGHTNIGAGRVVFQDLPKITKAIDDGDFFQNPAYVKAMTAAKEAGKAVHIMGLTSDGGVHSHIEHMKAAVKMAHQLGCEKIYVHCFLDGRDVPPHLRQGLCGRDAAGLPAVRRTDRHPVRPLLCHGSGHQLGSGRKGLFRHGVRRERRVQRRPGGCRSESYDAGVTDEFLIPVVCTKDACISEGDACIFMNFRPDRAREITRTLVDPDFEGFQRRRGFFDTHFVCTTSYDATMPNVEVAFPKESLHNIFGQYISDSGLTQLRIAETEKYAHVTFFFNGGVEQTFPGEDRCLVASPKVATYDLQPEMSAYEVCDKCVERIKSGKYDVIILNYANCDMVGHTGVFEAAVKAVETVDECVGRTVDAIREMGGIALITADHGNAEQMLQEDGKSPFTAHTTNLVPFCIVGADVKLRDGRLADIAPTMLDLMGLEKPVEMTGESLIG